MALQPDSKDAVIAELVRRVTILEAASRVNVNWARVKFAWALTTASPDVYDAYTFCTATSATYQDSDGNTGAGLPKVLVQHNSRILVLAGLNMFQVASDVTFRTNSWNVGVGYNEVNTASWPSAVPLMAAYATHGPTTEGNSFTHLIKARADMPLPGTATRPTDAPRAFQMSILATTKTPGAVTLPLPDPNSCFLAVIPLD